MTAKFRSIKSVDVATGKAGIIIQSGMYSTLFLNCDIGLQAGEKFSSGDPKSTGGTQNNCCANVIITNTGWAS